MGFISNSLTTFICAMIEEQKLGSGYYLEICANSVASALAAQDGGASRIELCQQLEAGGVTPSAGQISLTRTLLRIGVHVLIRPRAGDFYYSDEEFREMLMDVLYCREIGCDGVVIGMLMADGRVDVARMRQLVEAAGPMLVTFHRAFDRSHDPFEALEDVIRCGCQRLLTSGLQDRACEAIPLLAELVERAGNRIEIMPGSGVTEENMVGILTKTGAKSVHSSAKVDVHVPPGKPQPKGWASTWVSSTKKVRTMADLLQNL